ncbi:MAG: hypothetical protein ACP5II_00220 [Infirmifilum sp.]
MIFISVGGLCPVLLEMFKHVFISTFYRGPKSCTRLAKLRAYADVLPEYRVALDRMDAMLRELEELQSRIESLLQEWKTEKTY